MSERDDGRDMMGHRVRVIRDGAEPFEGTLMRQDETGVVVHNDRGLGHDARALGRVADEIEQLKFELQEERKATARAINARKQ